jgi:zinc transporter ZupT
MILLYSLVVSSLLILGAVFSSYISLSQRAKNFGQHFLAGIIIGCVSIELIPKITHQGISITEALGFFFGIILMLVLNNISERIKNKKLAI